MKKIKEWWNNTNKPNYKKTLDELKIEEKKDIRGNWILTGLILFFIILLYKTMFDIGSVFIDILRIDGVSNEIIVIIVMGFMLVAIMMFIFFVNMTLNLSNRNDILLRIKQLSIQLKLHENQEVICNHRFLDMTPETKCVWCGKTLLETKDKEEKT